MLYKNLLKIFVVVSFCVVNGVVAAENTPVPQSLNNNGIKVDVSLKQNQAKDVKTTVKLAKPYVEENTFQEPVPVISDTPEITYEQTYILKSKGQKAGFAMVRQRRKSISKNFPVIVTERHIEQKLKQLNDEVTIVQDQIFTEDLGGRPVEFIFTSKSTTENIEVKGEIDSVLNQIKVDYYINGIKDSKSINISKDFIFPYAIEKLFREKKNEKFKYYTLEPGIDLQILKIKVENQGQEMLEVKGKAEQYDKYRTEVSIFPNTSIYEWRDKNGHIVKEYTSLMDTEQMAVGKDEITDIPSSFDVFSASLIKLPKGILSPESIEQIIYKVSADEMQADNLFLIDKIQNIIQRQGDTVYLKVKADKPNFNKFKYPVNTETYEEYLESGQYIITDSPKIQLLADSLSAGQEDAYAIATSMKEWVYKNINNKKFSFDFGNALKVLETKSGDCTEHSLLLASLLRSAGIPSKVVVGLVYTDDPEEAFAYHMWVKAYVGEWISLDPTQRYKNFTPAHIAMAESSLNNISEKSELMMNIVKSFSKMQIEILNSLKPVISNEKIKPQIKINLQNNNYTVGNNFIDVKIKEIAKQAGKVSEINFGTVEEKDYIKDAFYSFSLGETDKALAELKNYYKTIDPNDDFMKMKLALKLINMSYFNFAQEVFNGIKNQNLWRNKIQELKELYFPKKMLPNKEEQVVALAVCAINHQSSPDIALDATEKIGGYDYVYYIRAKAYWAKKEYVKAEKELIEALKINSDNLTYIYELAQLYAEQKKRSLAQKQLASLNLLVNRKKIIDKPFLKKLKSADYWDKVKQFRGNRTLSKYYQANYNIINGEFDSAISILSGVAKKSSQPYIYELLADAYYEIESFKSAQKYYVKAIALDENRAKSFRGLANIKFIYGYEEKAEKYYKIAIEKSPRDADTFLALAKLYKYQKRYAEAIDNLKKVLEIDNNNQDALYNLSMILSENGRKVEAEELLMKVLSIDPMQKAPWLNLAMFRIAEGNYNRALQHLRNVKYIDPNDANYYFLTGVILKEKGNIEEAKMFFKKALELDPNII